MKKASVFWKIVLAFLTLSTTSFFPLIYSSQAAYSLEQTQSPKGKGNSKRTKRDVDAKREAFQSKNNLFKGKWLQKIQIFQSLEKYDLNEFKNKSNSPLVDGSVHFHHLVFIWSLWRVINSTLWADQVYGLPWIESIEGVLPENTFMDKEIDFDMHRQANPYKSEKIEELDLTLKADQVRINISQEDIQNMKNSETQDRVIQLRQNMGELYSAFFLDDWKPKSELNNWHRNNTVKTLFTTFTKITRKGRKLRTLRFIRKYQNRFYYLDINFNIPESGNSLMIQYVWYKDISWYNGGYYQSNGESHYRDKLGGDIVVASAEGFPINDMDKEFQTMFENIYKRPDILYKFVLAIKNCLEFPECSFLFHRHKNDYFILKQQEPGISKADSYNREIYKNIHPFSKKYYEAEKIIKGDPPGQFLFPLETTDHFFPTFESIN